MSWGSRLLARVVLVAAMWVGLAAPSPAAAPTGATISLEKTELQPGQRVGVTLAGWRARNVNLAVCGNLARRGSADCNVTASQDAQLLNGAAPASTYLFVFAPPTTCPCVVRASSATQDEVVFAPIELIGVPVGPVVGPAFEVPVSVAIRARPVDRGLVGTLRSTLGGPTAYRVTVTVQNVSPETISTVALAGTAGRNGDRGAVSFDIPLPGAIEPGHTWEHAVLVSLPPTMLGRATWSVVVSGAGAPAEVTTASRHAPVGLFVLAAVLAGDLVAMAWHFTARTLVARRARPRRTQDEGLVHPALTIAPALLGRSPSSTTTQ